MWNTYIQNTKRKNSYIGISKDDATSIKGEGDFNGDNIC